METISTQLSDRVKQRLARQSARKQERLLKLAQSLHLVFVGPFHRGLRATSWRCQLGHEWIETANRLEARGGCPECLKKRYLTWSHYHALAREKALVLVGEKPLSSDIDIRWRCIAKNHILYASYDDVRVWKACPACQNRVQLTLDDYASVATARGGEYVGTLPRTRHDQGQWRCSLHGVWSASYNSIVGQKSWCPACSGKVPKTLSDYEAVAASKGGRFVGSLPVNVDSAGLWECALKHRWQARYNDVSRKSWCPKCAGKVLLTVEDYETLAGLLGISFVGTLPPNKGKSTHWQTASQETFKASYKDLAVQIVGDKKRR